MNTARQAYMGMVGLFLISDDEEAALKLPSGQYDVPLLIQDKRFDANKQLVYTPTMEDMATGWLGDQILINGTPNAYLNVAPTVYRLRLINGSNARIYNIAFEGISPTNSFTVIGNDGGLLDKSFSATAIKLAPAERLDILIDLSANKQSDVITMKSLTFSDTSAPGSGTLPQGAPVDLLELHLTKSGSSGFGGLPPVLSQITPYKVANVVTTRPFEFVGHNYINFNSFNMTRIDEHVPLGDLEQWTFINQSDVVHPVHVHGTQFQVLDRGTDNLPEPAEAGWKDVVRLDPFQRMNVLVHFTDYTGIYLIHCHNLEHEDMGMMSNFQVEGPNAVKDEHAETAGIRISPNPATDHATLNFPPLQKDEVLAVTDEKGNLLLKKILAQGSETYFFMMNDLPSGSYLLELGRYKGRMIVMK